MYCLGRIMPKYYAVRVGRKIGVYSTWEECKQQVHGYSGAVYKSFSTLSEANHFNEQEKGGASYKERSRSTRYAPYISRRGQGKHYHSNSGDIPVVYSDGCCYSNGCHGARGGIGVYWSDDSKWNVSERLTGKQTNQRAELQSACRAIEVAIEQGHTDIELKTDSDYTIKAVTEWIQKWERDGWITSTGKPVKNKEDIVKLNDLCKKVNVKWTHVPGHVGIHGNEMADRLAKQGSQL